MREKNRIMRGDFLFIFALLFVACNNTPSEKTEELYKPFDYVQIIGHMGDSTHCPPNTLPAFEYAVTELGLHWIECDPQVTKDGEIVLCHDEAIDNCSNGGGT